jgi:hypothetical protein
MTLKNFLIYLQASGHQLSLEITDAAANLADDLDISQSDAV